MAFPSGPMLPLPTLSGGPRLKTGDARKTGVPEKPELRSRTSTSAPGVPMIFNALRSTAPDWKIGTRAGAAGVLG